jgi:hypothetical protein
MQDNIAADVPNMYSIPRGGGQQMSQTCISVAPGPHANTQDLCIVARMTLTVLQA